MRNEANGALVRLGQIDIITALSDKELTGLPEIPVSQFRSRSPDAVRALAGLLQRKISDGVRRSVVMSLKALHTRETVPALVEAIGDADSFVAYDAIAGLTAYLDENQARKRALEKTAVADWVLPAFEDFQRERSKYIEVWRSINVSMLLN